MTHRQESSGKRPEFSDRDLDVIGAYLPQIRRELEGQRILVTYLVIGAAVGLIAHVAGYLIRPMAGTEPFGLVADLLYSLGLALWTGVVVALFAQVLPEAKRRQVQRAIAAYEDAVARRNRQRRRGRGTSERAGRTLDRGGGSAA